MKAAVFAGLIVLALAVVSMVSPGELEPTRIGATLLLLALGSSLTLASWPKTTRIGIDIERRTLHAFDDDWSLDDVSQLVPRGDWSRDDDLVAARYCVDVLLKDGTRLPLLAHPDPAKVFADLTRLVDLVGCPVQPGWGLPSFPEARGAPGVQRARLEPERSVTLRISPLVNHRSVGKVVIAFGAIALLNFVVLIGIEFDARMSSLSLSLILPALTAVVPLFAGTAVLTRYDELRIAEDVSLRRLVFGFPFESRRLACEDLYAVHLVHPDGDPPKHLLLLTTTGPLAFPCAPADIDLDIAVGFLRKMLEPAKPGPS